MKRLIFLVCICSSYISLGMTISRNYLSPLDYGLLDAKSDVERYFVLLKCHKDALLRGVGVCYKGINSLTIELPVQGGESIPVTDFTDFAGVAIKCIYHGRKNCILFSMEANGKPLKINECDVDFGQFKNYPEISSGRVLLTIKDENPWVIERKGYGYSHFRKDILLLQNGLSSDRPIMPYSNEQSRLSSCYCVVSPLQKEFKNLVFVRDASNTAIVKLLLVDMQYNLKISNICVFTPSNGVLFGDGIFTICNSINISLDNIKINGTYSQLDKYGYAFDINNVNGLYVRNLKAFGKWGVFGTNNLQKVELYKCDINRIDIHCYGEDVNCKKCRFSQLYNQFSSTYGIIYFKNCQFDGTIPYMNAGSYNSFVHVNLVFRNCIFNFNNSKKDIIQIMGLSGEINQRKELRKKYLPNVKIVGCKVFFEGNVDNWRLINIFNTGNDPDVLANIPKMIIKRLGISNSDVPFSFYNRTLTAIKSIDVSVVNSDNLDNYINFYK